MARTELWVRFFAVALRNFRQENPTDDRSDSEILLSMITELYNRGIAGKNDSGEFTLPAINNAAELYQRMVSHKR